MKVLTISEQIKSQGKQWHDTVERNSPISDLLESPYQPFFEERIETFKRGMQPLWERVLIESAPSDCLLSIQQSFKKIYGPIKQQEPSQNRLKNYAFQYVLLGSSMGSAYIFKALNETGYHNLTYFEASKTLAPEFIALKRKLDNEIQPNEVKELISYIEEAYATIRF